MAVGVGEQAGEEYVAGPVAGVAAEGDERGEPGEDPDVGGAGDEGAFVKALGEPGD